MPVRHDEQLRISGTRVRLHPQPRFMPQYAQPETVWLSLAPGRIGPGPADGRMYTVDALDKKAYAPDAFPPWTGQWSPPVTPGPDGHFDHIDPASREFGVVHMYGTVRRVLDIWEGYLGYPVEWHFHDLQPRLELIPYIDWDNAQSGYGFMETGYGKPRGDGPREPFCLNFDVLAHETGHLLMFSLIGIPDNDTLTTEFRGFHEASSDLVALICALHFPSVVEHVLAGCRGNLYVENEIERIAELSPTEQIRSASNSHRMSEVPDVRTPWDKLTQPQLHQVGEPMTGAIFDILVEIYQQILVEEGVISRDLADLADRAADGSIDVHRVREPFDAAYTADPSGFHQALARARDIVGWRLAQVWQQTSPHNLNFAGVAARFLTIDRRRSGQRFQMIIRNSFRWRQIGPGFLPGAAR
ncbi:MAG: hypothetical protein IPK66_02315 [Rhodospirillales bacterium]|nr:hypothetical protein [Rhodospirillales bacterium]